MDRILSEAIKRADAAEVFGAVVRHTSVRFENDRLKGVDDTESAGAGLRVVREGKIGFSNTTKLDDPVRIAEDAAEVALYGEPATFEFAKPNGAVAVKGLFDPAVPDVALDDMIAMGQHIVDTVKRGLPDAMVRADVSKAVYEITVANSSGLQGTYKKTFFSAAAGATLVEGDNILDWWDGRSEMCVFEDVGPGCDRLVETMKIARNTVSLDGAPMSVILSPNALVDIFCTLESGLNGEQIAKGMSPLVGKIGERVLDQRITMVDDGAVGGMYGSAPFDDEGTPHARLPLFERGVLRNVMTNLKYAKELGIAPTGHGMRAGTLGSSQSYNAKPSIGMTNWIMEPGDMAYADMLADVQRGLLIESIPDAMMGNIANGDVSGRMWMAFLIEKGAVVGRVKDMAVSGNIYKMFKDNILALSKECSRPWWTSSYLLPHVYLKDVAISGKSIRPDEAAAENAA